MDSELERSLGLKRGEREVEKILMSSHSLSSRFFVPIFSCFSLLTFFSVFVPDPRRPSTPLPLSWVQGRLQGRVDFFRADQPVN